MKKPSRKPADYRKPGSRPIWCPGCGLFGIHTSLLKAFSTLGLKNDNVSIVTGIGCSSRLPFFVDTYGYHSLHGRALPTALGLKVVRPDLTVVVAGGDGDGLSIGGNHFIHAARRNPDITYIMSNNAIYGMTKGQLSPTSPYGMKSSSTPLGSFEYPLNPAAMALVSGATYVARGYPVRAEELANIIAGGIAHPGFAFIEVLSPCVTFNKAVGYDSINIAASDLPEEHSVKDRQSAMGLAMEEKKTYFGVFYRARKSTYHDRMKKLYGTQCQTGETYEHLLKMKLFG